MITIKDLKKSFNGFEVLKGLSLSIPANKITFIMGQSGTGKSVLLKHIVGLLKPDSGEIWFEGEDITKLSEKELRKVRKKIGYLFQEGALFDSMTVKENVMFPLKEHFKMSKAEMEKRAEELLSAVNLLEAQNKYPSELSGGMRKRAALARTLALQPQIILFDEPTTGLDPILQVSIMELIRDLKEKYKLTCIVVSHDVALSFKFADYIAFLYKGVILEAGTPEEIKHSQNLFIKKFIKSALI
jgi:phospholipid/cholesterol/gamma-HCH transport system ATP-binding protein